MSDSEGMVFSLYRLREASCAKIDAWCIIVFVLS
jgi:hypothetical protein